MIEETRGATCAWCKCLILAGIDQDKNHGICPPCNFEHFQISGCGCPEHKDKCRHCWGSKEIEREISIDREIEGITYECLTCGELSEVERLRDESEHWDDRLDELETRAEERRDLERERKEMGL